MLAHTLNTSLKTQKFANIFWESQPFVALTLRQHPPINLQNLAGDIRRLVGD